MSQPERKKVIEKSALGYFSDRIKAWVSNMLNGKVDKVTGKQLSTEDYTTAEKTKLASAVTTANIVDNLTSTATDKPLSAKQGKAINDMMHGAWDLIAASEWGVNDGAPGAISVTVAQKYSELMLIGYTPGAGAAADVIECRLPLSVNAFTRSATIDLDQLPSKWAVYLHTANASNQYGTATYTPSSRVLTVQATEYLGVVCAFAR